VGASDSENNPCLTLVPHIGALPWLFPNRCLESLYEYTAKAGYALSALYQRSHVLNKNGAQRPKIGLIAIVDLINFHTHASRNMSRYQMVRASRVMEIIGFDYKCNSLGSLAQHFCQ